MLSLYQKNITIAAPEGSDTTAIEAQINEHLGGANTFADAAVFLDAQGQRYRVLSFAARLDFSITVGDNALISIGTIYQGGREQIAALGLEPVL